MLKKGAKTFEIAARIFNFIVISYVLTSAGFSFWDKWFGFLFILSNIWVIENFWRSLMKLTKSRSRSVILFTASLLALCLISYFGGYIHGVITPFGE